MPSWLVMVPSAAGLAYLVLQTIDRPAAYALVAPWLPMNPGPARAELLASNLLAAIAATLSLFAGLQVYRLIRLAGLPGIEEDKFRKPVPPRATTVLVVACLLIPFADLYGQFDLVRKNKEIAAQAELHKNAKKLRIRDSNREVRVRPDRDAAVIGTLAVGATVAILETRSGWGRIADDQWVILSDSGSATASARPKPATSESTAKGHSKTGKRDMAEKLAARAAVAAGGRVGNRPAEDASPAQSSPGSGDSHAPAVNADGKDPAVETLHCLGASVQHRPHTLRLATKGEWTEYEKRQERIAVLKCVRYRGEPFVVIAVTGTHDRRAGIEAYSLDTLDKRFGYLCVREECHDTALPFPDDFPLDKR